MNDSDVGQIVTLARGHAWIPLAAVVIGILVRLCKSDDFVAWFPVSIRGRWLPWFAMGLGVVSGILNAIVGGEKWTPALLGGLASAMTAISSHNLVVDSLRKGRDIGEPKYPT